MKSIYFLRYFFSFGYFLLIVGFVGMGIAYLLNIVFGIGSFNPSFFNGVGEVTTKLSYSLGDNVIETATKTVDVSIKHLSSQSMNMKMLGFMNFSIIFSFSIFNLKYLSSLFCNLSEVDSWGGYFTRENYSLIRRITYLTLGATLYAFFINSFISWFLINDLTVFGESFQLYPDKSILASFITVLVLFGAAKIFKAAIEMKEESEYTI